jgi:retron-type reverse transcriptase
VKRHGNLWPALIDFANLHAAARKAARGKRRRAAVAHFEFHLERELLQLQEELIAQTWTPGPYRNFYIHEPKKRLISAAPFRDRVVHHALYNVLAPIFEATFVHDTYACRVGKGTHAAVDRFQHFARRFRYLLKCDVARYFPSIDHTLLKAQLRRKIKDRAVLWLADRIIDHSPPFDDAALASPGSSTPGAQRQVLDSRGADGPVQPPLVQRRGLPLGNQTSQFFGNVYLSPFDRFVLEQIQPGGYLRYVDDFVLFADHRTFLRQARERCQDFLETLRLRLHPHKVVLARAVDGMRFLGYRVSPDQRRMPRPTLVRLRRGLRRVAAQVARGELAATDVRRRLAGWLGHARPAGAESLYWRLFAEHDIVESAGGFQGR